MAVFRIDKTKDYTVMANFHLRDKSLSLKAKGLLSLMLSLPEDWDYTTKGLAYICKDGVDSICAAVKELENAGYVQRKRNRNSQGRLTNVEYTILEKPISTPEVPQAAKRDKSPKRENPVLDNPVLENPRQDIPEQDLPKQEKPAQLNTYLTNHLFNELYNLLSTKDAELIELYQQYIQARDKMNSPLNETSLEKLISRAKKLSKDNVIVEKVLLENAIINNWKNVYPPRESELARLNADLQNTMRDMFGLEDDL